MTQLLVVLLFPIGIILFLLYYWVLAYVLPNRAQLEEVVERHQLRK